MLQLTSYPASEQFAFGLYEQASALTQESEMACGTMPRRMDRRCYNITNRQLFTQPRWFEFLRMMEQTKELGTPEEIASMFRCKGVDTRNGNIKELYLDDEDLLCNYRFQVDLAVDAQIFIKVLAYAKDSAPRRHHH